MTKAPYRLLVGFSIALLCSCQSSSHFTKTYTNVMPPGTERYLLPHAGTAEIRPVDNTSLIPAIARLERRGYVVIGSATFVIDIVDITDEVRTKAHEVQADLVVVCITPAAARQEIDTQSDYNPNGNIGGTTGGQVSTGGNGRVGNGQPTMSGPVSSGAMGNMTPEYNVHSVPQVKYTSIFLRKRAFVAGADVELLTEAQRQASSLSSGATVVSVVEDSPAYRASIRPGDIVTAVEGQSFDTVVEYQKLINARAGGLAHFSLYRHGIAEVVVVQLNPLPPGQ